ncbi:unnamed protein product [Rhizoctonia solani]|uniref:Uncharacterized protein n=1 Tax=Rhizoctonia solani TaxID=456999 RepID=A0A8H3AV10_9AGAM|nr:unnamed protein product [Rhizoctonia solani]
MLAPRTILEHRNAMMAIDTPPSNFDLDLDLDLDFELDPNPGPDPSTDESNTGKELMLPSLEGDLNTLLSANPTALFAAANSLASGSHSFTDISDQDHPLLGYSHHSNLLPPVQGLRRNPPVTIEEWPDIDDLGSDKASDEDEPVPADGLDCDPPFTERETLPGFDPIDEPLLTDEEMLEILEMELGDFEETDEWINMCKLN